MGAVASRNDLRVLVTSLKNEVFVKFGTTFRSHLFVCNHSLLALTQFPTVSTDVLVALVRSSSFGLIKPCWREAPLLILFLKVGASFTLRLLMLIIPGRIIRSPDALRPLILCNCDCKVLTSAICRGFHWYSMQCIHTSQSCISSRQLTDNIFEIETTALVHVARAPQNSGVLLTDFTAPYPSVNHSWIFFCASEHWVA